VELNESGGLGKAASVAEAEALSSGNCSSGASVVGESAGPAAAGAIDGQSSRSADHDAELQKRTQSERHAEAPACACACEGQLDELRVGRKKTARRDMLYKNFKRF
jgi:hypothetical protein